MEHKNNAKRTMSGHVLIKQSSCAVIETIKLIQTVDD